MEDVKRMTITAIENELAALGVQFEEFRANCDGHGGSPGEWMIERMDELDTELRKRMTAVGETF